MLYMSYMIQYYYNVLTSNRFNSPNFTDLFRITESILYKDEKKHKKQIERIKELDGNINQIGVSVAEMELIFFKNVGSGINKQITINGETYTLGYLFKVMNEIIRELTFMVSEVAYNYDVDIPLNRGSNKIEW